MVDALREYKHIKFNILHLSLKYIQFILYFMIIWLGLRLTLFSVFSISQLEKVNQLSFGNVQRSVNAIGSLKNEEIKHIHLLELTEKRHINFRLMRKYVEMDH